jgi:hypothetical protein
MGLYPDDSAAYYLYDQYRSPDWDCLYNQ